MVNPTCSIDNQLLLLYPEVVPLAAGVASSTLTHQVCKCNTCMHHPPTQQIHAQCHMNSKNTIARPRIINCYQLNMQRCFCQHVYCMHAGSRSSASCLKP